MQTDWWLALAGGGLIGVAASLLLLCNGRIAGISGILFGAMHPKWGDTLWRWVMLMGMVLAGYLFSLVNPEALLVESGRPRALVIGAGLLVGFGTRLGSGCTSGHGVCGLSRLSKRSLVATLTFMAAGIITVWVLGGVS